MAMIVDAREKSLIKLFAKNGVEISTTNLDLGDIVISADAAELDVGCIIIERKTIQDLLSSIRDGRYREQMTRLTGACELPNHNIYYLIEGKFETNAWNKISDADVKLVHSAIFSISYYHGFSVIRTQSVDETACVVELMFRRIQTGKFKRPYYNNHRAAAPHAVVNAVDAQMDVAGDAVDAQMDVDADAQLDVAVDADTDAAVCDDPHHPPLNYCSTIKKKKNANITPENIKHIMLQQIPGVSVGVSESIFSKYGSMFDLVSAVRADKNCLGECTMTNARGKKQKINKTTLARVVDFLSQI